MKKEGRKGAGRPCKSLITGRKKRRLLVNLKLAAPISSSTIVFETVLIVVWLPVRELLLS